MKWRKGAKQRVGVWFVIICPGLQKGYTII